MSPSTMCDQRHDQNAYAIPAQPGGFGLTNLDGTAETSSCSALANPYLDMTYVGLQQYYYSSIGQVDGTAGYPYPIESFRRTQTPTIATQHDPTCLPTVASPPQVSSFNSEPASIPPPFYHRLPQWTQGGPASSNPASTNYTQHHVLPSTQTQATPWLNNPPSTPFANSGLPSGFGSPLEDPRFITDYPKVAHGYRETRDIGETGRRRKSTSIGTTNAGSGRSGITNYQSKTWKPGPTQQDNLNLPLSITTRNICPLPVASDANQRRGNKARYGVMEDKDDEVDDAGDDFSLTIHTPSPSTAAALASGFPSPNTPWSPTEETPLDSRARSRLAATRSRAKSKIALDKLKADDRIVTETRQKLTDALFQLQEEVYALKQELLKHASCDCKLIQQYLSHTAKQVVGDVAVSATRGQHGRDTSIDDDDDDDKDGDY